MGECKICGKKWHSCCSCGYKDYEHHYCSDEHYFQSDEHKELTNSFDLLKKTLTKEQKKAISSLLESDYFSYDFEIWLDKE